MLLLKGIAKGELDADIARSPNNNDKVFRKWEDIFILGLNQSFNDEINEYKKKVPLFQRWFLEVFK